MLFETQLKCRCNVGSSFKSEGDAEGFFIRESSTQFRPELPVTMQHLVLDIEVDLASKKLQGSVQHEFVVRQPNVKSIALDAIDLKVSAVKLAEFSDANTRLNFTSIDFDQTPEKLNLQFKSPLVENSKYILLIEYSVVEPRAGLYFIEPNPECPNRDLQLWTQGQDEDNRYWIPCFDAPHAKITTEMKVRVASNLTAISNGKLLGKKAVGNQLEFHYLQSQPHSTYLISLCVGTFVEIQETYKKSDGTTMPVNYYTLPGKEDETRLAFGNTPQMLRFFSEFTGVEYPYDKYAQTVAMDFIYGGMENTSATTQTEYVLHPEHLEQEASGDPLVAHELAHQWFGDLLTCKDWSHAWLNEGFATYFETLWTEHHLGHEEFLNQLYSYESVYRTEEYQRPIVTRKYLRPSDLFDRHLYEKGARVLHMLRALVGDGIFKQAVHAYLKRYSYKAVETKNLQATFEEFYGQDLDWFFDQWLYKAGQPKIKVKTTWNVESKVLRLDLEQTHATNLPGCEVADVFRFPLDIKFGDTEKVSIFVNKKKQTFEWTLAKKPEFVAVNVANTLLCDLEYKPAQPELIAQLTSDSDIMGRIFAAKMLAKDVSRASINALGKALSVESFWGVQAELCSALSACRSALGKKYIQEVLSKGLLKHPKARREAIRCLGLYRDNSQRELFERVAQTDQSSVVHFEACLALGKLRTPEALTTLLGFVKKPRPTWHDTFLRGVVRGLAEFGLRTYVPEWHQDVLALIRPFTDARYSMFLRREVVQLLAREGGLHNSILVPFLKELTYDHDYFVRINSIHALESLGDSSANGRLQEIYDTAVEPRTRRAALMAIKNIRSAATSTHEQISKLKTEIDRLRDDLAQVIDAHSK